MLVSKLAACMIHLFHLNEVKFNFLKLFSCLCFDLDPETECTLFAEVRNGEKFQNGVILSKFDGKSSKVNQVIFFSATTSKPNMKALA